MKNITHQILVTVTPSKAFLAKLNKQSRDDKLGIDLDDTTLTAARRNHQEV